MASNRELQFDWLILCKNKENWDNTGKYRCLYIEVYYYFNFIVCSNADRETRLF